MKGKALSNPNRKALWLTGGVNAFVALAELVASPIHEAGRGQAVLGYVLGASHILGMPGLTVASAVGLRPRHDWTWQGFLLALVVNLAFYWIIGLMWWRHGRPKGTTPATDGAKTVSRRSVLVHSGKVIAGAGAAVAGWGFLGEARWFEVTRRTIPIKGLTPELDGLRIVHLTDIHHSQWMSIQWVREIVDAANALEPDVVALTGDYVYRGLQYVRPTAIELSKLKPRIGTVGVMGNHDWWMNGQLTKQAFAREGVPLIDNARRFVTPDRRLVRDARGGLCFAGVGDLWEDKCLYKDALGGVPGGMPRVLLSHNPDVAEEPDFLESGYRVDLMLSGHTHGGQIRLPGLGSPVTNSRLGQKYAQGLVQGPVCPVFVSRGLGMTVMPIRVGARPELAVIELKCA